MSLANIRLTSVGVLWIAVAALLLPVALIEYRVLQVTHGTLAYPLDDTFIHMTVARNLAFNHVWGITKDSFQSASSSPLYTVLLAGIFKVCGVHIIIPLLLNIVVGIVLLWAAQRWLVRQEVSPVGRLIILLLLIFLTPLPLLVISGMEHTLQLLFSFLFIFSFAAAVGGDADAAGRPGTDHDSTPLPWPVYLYGALMVTTRYECLIILGLVCLLLVWRRQWRTAFSLGAVSVMPIVAFGLFALSKGSFFLPNSVVLKSALPHSLHGLLHFAKEDIWSRMFFSLPPALHDYNILAAQRLLLLLPLCYLVFLPQVRHRMDYRYILIVLMGAALAHIAFAFPANFPRYEDYLIGCSVIIMGVVVARYGLAAIRGARWLSFRGAARLSRGGPVWVATGLGVVLLFPLLIRSEKSFQNSKWYCVNIFEQQYQMAQFVHRYYDSTGIAFNDIGAISFYSVGPKLDLFGLASLDVARRRRANRFTAGWADSLGRQQQIKLAIVYDTWQDSALLHRWNKIASWQNYHNVVLGSDSVSFYALDAADTTALRKNLEAYQPSLPADVTVRYY